MYPVEIVRLEKDKSTILAIGEISEERTAQLHILLCPDNVVRISQLVWDTMLPQDKKDFLVVFNATEVYDV
jgi:hypothetical protein